MKDGMDSDVLLFLVLLIPITMVQNAFVLILEINVNHGNSLMEYLVFISRVPVPRVQCGMGLIVHLIVTVLLDFIK